MEEKSKRRLSAERLLRMTEHSATVEHSMNVGAQCLNVASHLVNANREPEAQVMVSMGINFKGLWHSDQHVGRSPNKVTLSSMVHEQMRGYITFTKTAAERILDDPSW